MQILSFYFCCRTRLNLDENTDLHFPPFISDSEYTGPSSVDETKNEWAELPQRLTRFEVDTTSQRIKAMHKNISGLFSDNDLQKMNHDEIRFDFDKRILQIFNTAYFTQGEHWLLLVQLPGKNIQLFDSDIKYVQPQSKIDRRNVTDIPEIVQMMLVHLSEGKPFFASELKPEDLLALYDERMPKQMQDKLRIEPYCHKCTKYSQAHAKTLYLCMKCHKWYHESCMPSITFEGRWKCEYCVKQEENIKADAKQNNVIQVRNIQDTIELYIQKRVRPDRTLICDVNLGEENENHSWLAVKFPKSDYLLYNYKDHAKIGYLPHDLQIALVYLYWPKVCDDEGLKIDIMDCTQQKNDYDCGIFACLNAIHWASENSIPPDYLDNYSSDMTIPREKLQEFMHGGCDRIPRASAKADKVLKTITLNPKCQDKNCKHEISSNAPSEVNMFKCFICGLWFHNKCTKPDWKLRSIYRTYCQYCAEFLQFTDQSNEPHFNMTRTEAQGGVQTHQFYEDEKKPSTQLYAREANNKQSRVSPAGDPKLRKTIGLEVESEPCTHSSVTNQQVDDIFSDNDSECDKTPHEWDRISEDNSSNSSVPTDWEERNIEDNRDTDTEELL